MSAGIGGIGVTISAKGEALLGFFKNAYGQADKVADAVRGIGDGAAKASPSMNNLTKALSPLKVFGERMQEAGTLAAGLFRSMAGVKGSTEEFDRSLGKTGQPLRNFDKDVESSMEVMGAVDSEVERLAHSIGASLPKESRRGAERFKRASVGIGASQRAISSGFDLIKEGISKLNSILKVNMLQTFLQAVSLNKMGEIADGIAHIGAAGGELTTSFEAQAQATSVSVRKTSAQMGLLGKDLDIATSKATGLAMGMKVSEKTAASAVVSYKQFGGELKAFGIDSVETGVKLEDGLGVPVRDLGFNIHKMRVGLKLSDKDLEEVSRSFTATGESIHDMAHPLQNMDQLLQLAQRRANLASSKFQGIGGKESIKSINRATQALFVLTGDAKGAQEGAVALETKMVESMENFRNMFAGTSTDLDNFLINTSVVTGDVKQAFKSAEQGPDAFIKNFGTVIAKLKKGGKSTAQILTFFGGQMEQALGPELAHTLITAMANADDASMKTIKDLKTTGKALGAVSKEAWRSSQTLQEQYDLMTGQMMAQFRNLGSVSAQVFVNDMGTSFKKFNETAAGLSKKGGPLGMMVDKMAQVSFLGAKALLPEALRPMAAIFSHMSPMVFEAVKAFGALVPMLFALMNPLTLVIGAFTLLHLGFKQTQANVLSTNKAYQASKKRALGLRESLKGLEKGTDKYNDTLKKLREEQNLQGMLERTNAAKSRKKFREMLHEKAKAVVEFGKQIAKSIPDILHEISDEFQDLKNAIPWKKVWEQVKESALEGFHRVKNFAAGILTGFLEGFDPEKSEGKATASGLGEQIGAMVKEAFESVKTEIKDYFKEWWGHMGDIWEDKSKPFSDKVHETAEGSAGIIIGAFALGKFTPVFKVLGVLTSAVGPLVSLFGTIVELGAGLLSTAGIAFVVVAALAAVSAAFFGWPGESRKAVDAVSGTLSGGAKSLAEAGTSWVTSFVEGDGGWGTLPKRTGDIALRAITAVGDALDLLPKLALSIVDGMLDGIRDSLDKAFPEYKEIIDTFFGVVKTIVDTLHKGLRIILNPFKALSLGINLLIIAFKKLEQWVTSTTAFKVITAVLSEIGYIISRVVVIGFKVLNGKAGEVLGRIGGKTEWLSEKVIQPAWKTISSVITDVWTKDIKPVWDPVAKFFEDTFNKVSKAVTEAVAAIQAKWTEWKTSIKEFFDKLEKWVDDAFGHSWFTDAFNRAFKIITNLFHDMDALAHTVFEGLKGLVSTALKPITTIFDKVFGKSAPEAIAEGMDDAVKTMQAASDKVKGMVRKGFYDAIVDGVVRSFVDAYKEANDKTKDFLKKKGTFENLFTDFATSIKNIFKEMWRTTLEDAAFAVEQGLRPEIASALTELRSLETAMTKLKDYKASMAEDKKAKEAKESRQDKLTKSDAMAGSVSKGLDDWWLTAKDDYDKGVQQIVGAIERMGQKPVVAVAGAASTAAKSDRFKLLPTASAPNATGLTSRTP